MNGQEFREIRRELGLSQERLARQLGVTMNTVWRWETLQEVPKIPELAIRYLQGQLVGK